MKELIVGKKKFGFINSNQKPSPLAGEGRVRGEGIGNRKDTELGHHRYVSVKKFTVIQLIPFWILAFAGMVLALPVYGQEAKPKELTLGEVLRLAEKNSPSLKAALSRENETREFGRASDSGFFP